MITLRRISVFVVLCLTFCVPSWADVVTDWNDITAQFSLLCEGFDHCVNGAQVAKEL